jgi:hypothetical protein
MSSYNVGTFSLNILIFIINYIFTYFFKFFATEPFMEIYQRSKQYISYYMSNIIQFYKYGIDVLGGF